MKLPKVPREPVGVSGEGWSDLEALSKCVRVETLLAESAYHAESTSFSSMANGALTGHCVLTARARGTGRGGMTPFQEEASLDLSKPGYGSSRPSK